MIQTVRGELGHPRTAVLCPDFDLALTLRSGQVFRWREIPPAGFSGWIDGSLAHISQEADQLTAEGVSPESARQFFALDLDLPAITRQIDVDPLIHDALGRYPGLRVIRQDPWECACSFMLSAYNNIPRLTAMIETLCARFGKAVGSGCGTAVRSVSSALRASSVRALTSRAHRNPASYSSAGDPRRGDSLSPSLAPPPFKTQKEQRNAGSVPARSVKAGLSRTPSPTSSAASVRSPAMGRAATALPLAARAWRPPRFLADERGRGQSEAASPGQPSDDEAASPSGGSMAYSFPGPEVLANVSERVLRNCGLGYRAPYLKAMARAVASGRADLERWGELEDEELRRALLTLPGIGEKVVECVMLFAYGRAAAFPVDVWIGRAMRGWYFRRRKVSDKKIREFARKHFGPYCGWAQQYLYCLARWNLENSRIV